MLTSCGSHLSVTNQDDDVKLMSAGPTCQPQFSLDDAMLTSCWRQRATWTSHSVTRVSPGIIQPYPIYRNGFNLWKFIENSYDLRKMWGLVSHFSKNEPYDVDQPLSTFDPSELMSPLFTYAHTVRASHVRCPGMPPYGSQHPSAMIYDQATDSTLLAMLWRRVTMTSS